MEYINKLSERNAKIIDNLLDDDYRAQSYEDSVDTGSFVEANQALGEHLYGVDIADLVRRNKVLVLDKMQLEVIDSVSAPESILDGVDISRLGVVVVRPEAIGLADTSRTFLERSGLNIALDRQAQINFEQYWSLYGPGLIDPDAKYDFPTRTLNYINQPIRIFVTVADPTNLSAKSVSGYITQELKGRQGSYVPNTLRGDIAYTALRGLVNLDSSGFVDKQANLALDPIGAYRQIVRGDVLSDRMHATAGSPILFYAGQSVHVPDDSEIARDLRILLSEEDIAIVIEEVNNDRTIR